MAALETDRCPLRSDDDCTERWRLGVAKAIHGGFNPRVGVVVVVVVVDCHQAATRTTQTEGAAGRCSVRRRRRRRRFAQGFEETEHVGKVRARLESARRHHHLRWWRIRAAGV